MELSPDREGMFITESLTGNFMYEHHRA